MNMAEDEQSVWEREEAVPAEPIVTFHQDQKTQCKRTSPTFQKNNRNRRDGGLPLLAPLRSPVEAEDLP
jgi:hypothetical protein